MSPRQRQESGFDLLRRTDSKADVCLVYLLKLSNFTLEISAQTFKHDF